MDIGLKYFFLGLLFGSKYYLSDIFNLLVLFLFFYSFFKVSITLVDLNDIIIIITASVIENFIVGSLFSILSHLLCSSRIFLFLYYIYNLVVVSVIFLSLLLSIISMYYTYNTSTLVITGPYSFVRHPLYLSLLVFISFIFIKINTFISLVFFLYNTKFLHKKIKEEEDELSNKYVGYKKYKDEVPYGLLDVNEYF